jgi:hypothetical protein
MTKPSAKDWRNRPVDDWNVSTVITYIADKHLEVYGVEYMPFRSWAAERGLIGNLIGTSGKNAKPRKYEPAVIKAFLDECFASHKVSAQYPGVTFTWFWSYKSHVLQRVLAETANKAKMAAKVESTKATDWDELADWL